LLAMLMMIDYDDDEDSSSFFFSPRALRPPTTQIGVFVPAKILTTV
jgi:hypothetical protein